MDHREKKNYLKLGGILALIAALLVLGANALLSQYGAPLPEDLTDRAEAVIESVLDDAQGGDPADTLNEGEAAPSPSSDTGEVVASVPEPAAEALWVDAQGDFDYYVLALSWQPAFCETEPGKPECVSQTASRYDATHFALHGLWPNMADDPGHTFAYCDVAYDVARQDQRGDWCAIPLVLSDGVADDLSTLMPGATSCLHHHEWIKHGTCAGMSSEAYFALSNALVVSFSQTDFNRYVSDRAGQMVTRNELLDQFDREFGPGASDYLSLRCDDVGKASLLTEVQLTLRQDLGADLSDFGQLFAPDYADPHGSCPREFAIDGAGLGDF